ncbi:hypothetical protein HNO92_001244 [Chromobacterium alkanivorans]|uniref:DUF3443 domain-containing protein n=1 Tax=Chromobacterium alkanivorans TaxID=1071719 RepID=UPI002168C3CC|nr:DUF3443 domain-containing protein [Chromobacterium alkanivorans]MCS3804856.1 hypothetical protein [Chromobacterium alkanivorans]MCS3819195.1 hypothetical protein [Chromobacterium alkanivorans]MCS3872947.1 hypothetical protein [Chromobacterium alkanivorans]
MKQAIFGLALTCALLLTACGGGGGGIGSVSPPDNGGSTANSVTMTVDSGPVANVYQINMPYVSVTVCAPGGSPCQTISRVLVDTGSSGLRLLASALSGSTLGSLPGATTNSRQLAECMQFASGFTWGSVRYADVKMAGKTASSLPIQIISDPAYSFIPAACSGTGSNLGSLSALGANGILGVGLRQQDCGSTCVNFSNNSYYYACPTALSCQPAQAAASLQVSNPLVGFASDNNGVMLQLPAVAISGAPSAAGTLYFGVGTQSNNALGAAKAFPTTLDGNGVDVITTSYKSLSYGSFLDSGSNGLFFPDATIATCVVGSSTWFCPGGILNLNATLSGGGNNSAVAFSLGNAGSLLLQGYSALPGVGAPASGLLLSSYFDWGLPFFYGRNVYIGLEGRSNPQGSGPMFLF